MSQILNIIIVLFLSSRTYLSRNFMVLKGSVTTITLIFDISVKFCDFGTTIISDIFAKNNKV